MAGEENPMRSSLALALATALFVSPAFAQSTGVTPADAAKQAQGLIVSIDALSSTVTLDNGETFQLPAAVKSTELKVGNKVRVEFATDDKGLKVATAIAAIVDAPAPVPATAPKATEGGAG
jgi:hypothetical protein